MLHNTALKSAKPADTLSVKEHCNTVNDYHGTAFIDTFEVYLLTYFEVLFFVYFFFGDSM